MKHVGSKNQSRIEEHPLFLLGGEGSPYHGNFVYICDENLPSRPPFRALTSSNWYDSIPSGSKLRTPSTQKKNIFHNTNLATQILLQLLPRDPDFETLKLRSRFHPWKKVTDKTPLHGSLGRTFTHKSCIWERYSSEPTFKTRQTVKVIICHLQGGLLSTLSIGLKKFTLPIKI